MRRGLKAALALSALLLPGCKEPSKPDLQNKDQPESSAVHEAPVPPPGTAPDAKTPLGRASPEVDPTSAEAAREVVGRYAELMANGRSAEAATLWSDKAAADAAAAKLRRGVRAEIGRAGALEGAAGSIYTTVPVVFSGTGSSKAADFILRRVNDVPGSTAEQRRWHIERIDWRSPG